MTLKNSPQLNQHRALHILNGLPKIGPIALKRLLEHFHNDAVAILNASAGELLKINHIGHTIVERITAWPKFFNPEREDALLKKHNGVFITCQDADYPPLLKEIYDPPIGLNFLGQYRPKTVNIALIGTRYPSAYGRRIAKQLAIGLAQCGFCIVSGMARGIDKEAHVGAIEAGGKTIAVLGCGPDIVYPPENLELYRTIIEQGAIISEYPFGRRADKQTFPMRNRIIAGMCEATVVIESKTEGGAMITAQFAADQGRQVFAVPGPIDQATSAGCHQLIRDGATLLSSIDELLQELQYLGVSLPIGDDNKEKTISTHAKKVQEATLPAGLNREERAIMLCFDQANTLAPDKIVEQTGLKFSIIASTLICLEMKGLLIRKIDGRFERSSI